MVRVDERYKTARAFRAAITERLKMESRKTGLPYDDQYRRVAIDRFLARIDWTKWTAKGGYIMQRRLPKARATKDIDLSTDDPGLVLLDETSRQAVLAAHFQNMAKIDLGDFFEFVVAVSKPLPGFGKGGIRCNVRCLLDAKSFATFQLDAVIQDETVFQSETIVGDKFLAFAGIESLSLKAAMKEEVFAEKIHAYTLPRESENTRVKDLLDLVLLVQSGLDLEKLRLAIYGVFSIRKTHTVPLGLASPPESWSAIFAALVRDTGIEMTLDSAFTMVSDLYDSLKLSGE